MNDETKKLIEEIGGDDEKNELEELRREKALVRNLEDELKRLVSLFPDMKAGDIPEELFERCDEGRGLAGEYALWYLADKAEKERARATNEANSVSAPPDIKDGSEEVYFTPEAVAAMTEKEVKKNYKQIMKSMEKWNSK